MYIEHQTINDLKLTIEVTPEDLGRLLGPAEDCYPGNPMSWVIVKVHRGVVDVTWLLDIEGFSDVINNWVDVDKLVEDENSEEDKP